MKLVVVSAQCGPDTITFIEYPSKEEFLLDFSKGVEEYHAHYAMFKQLTDNIKTASESKEPKLIENARIAYEDFSNAHRTRQSGAVVDGVGYPLYITHNGTECNPIRLPTVYTVDEWYENNCKKTFSVLGHH